MTEFCILIADSGSTKTEWLLTGENEKELSCTTQGLNPYMLEDHEVRHVLAEELLPSLGGRNVRSVFFYGAGCRGEQADRLRRLLSETFPAACAEVASDMLGAARSACGRKPGIAAILGTGSNSCYYDGSKIARSVPSLGFIVGDEGSGAALGKRLAGDVLKGRMRASLCKDFHEETGETMDSILHHVYRMPLPNRYLASFTFFLHAHRADPEIRALLIEEFERFFSRNIAPYGHPELPVAFVGSVAHYFSEEVTVAAQKCGISISGFSRTPMRGLADYHRQPA